MHWKKMKERIDDFWQLLLLKQMHLFCALFSFVPHVISESLCNMDHNWNGARVTFILNFTAHTAIMNVRKMEAIYKIEIEKHLNYMSKCTNLHRFFPSCMWFCFVKLQQCFLVGTKHLSTQTDFQQERSVQVPISRAYWEALWNWNVCHFQVKVNPQLWNHSANSNGSE